MKYSDPDRLLHYENNVDIKQGADRMTAGIADVYLQKDGTKSSARSLSTTSLSFSRASAHRRLVQYTNADEVAVLKGNPAHVEDAEQGTTDGNRLTMYRRENRVVVDDTRGPQSPGRVPFDAQKSIRIPEIFLLSFWERPGVRA